MNWMISVEQLESDVNYTQAPVIGLQVQDFALAPEKYTSPFTKLGIAVQHQTFSAEAANNGIVEPDLPAKAHAGQLVSVVDDWPSDMSIPAGTVVIPVKPDEETEKQITTDGYEYHPSVESYLAQLDISTLKPMNRFE